MHNYLVDDKKHEIISEKAPACANRNCGGSRDAALYKTCHYCVTIYCSRECRSDDWARHRDTECHSGRMASYCKKILTRLSNNVNIREELSRIAVGSFSNSHKRGFVWLDFSSSHVAFDFYRSLSSDNHDVAVLSPLENLFLKYFGDFFLPVYVLCENLRNNVITMLFNDDDDFEQLTRVIGEYEPTREFILLVSIRVPNVKGRLFVVKFVKLNVRLRVENCPASKEQPVVILTSLPRSDQQTKQDEEESRQLFLANLLNEFEMRGINLRERYPKIYTNLCLYVEENRPFTPVCLFPRDLNKNNLFMCLIMPNSEPVADYSITQETAKKQPFDYDQDSYVCIY